MLFTLARVRARPPPPPRSQVCCPAREEKVSWYARPAAGADIDHRCSRNRVRRRVRGRQKIDFNDKQPAGPLFRTGGDRPEYRRRLGVRCCQEITRSGRSDFISASPRANSICLPRFGRRHLRRCGRMTRRLSTLPRPRGPSIGQACRHQHRNADNRRPFTVFRRNAFIAMLPPLSLLARSRGHFRPAAAHCQ